MISAFVLRTSVRSVSSLTIQASVLQSQFSYSPRFYCSREDKYKGVARHERASKQGGRSMSTPPPRKRLKQSTLVESFRKQASREAERASPQESQESPTQEPEVDESMNKCMREKLLDAAERRRAQQSPDFTPPHEPDYTEENKPQEPETGDVPAATSESSTVNHEVVIVPDESEPVTRADKPSKTEETIVLSDTEEGASTSKRDVTDDDVIVMGSSPSVESPEPSPKKKTAKRRNRPNECRFKGTPISGLQTEPGCSARLDNLIPTPHHTVLFNTRHMTSDVIPRPYPHKYEDAWDSEHVRLPCSAHNEYPVDGIGGKRTLKRRWELIENALLADIDSSLDLEEAIMQYNRGGRRWDFSGLHRFFTEELEAEEARHFFKHTMPRLVKLALQLPELCTRPIPLLRRQQKQSVSMSQQQAACLLANAFFCTFPRRHAYSKCPEYQAFPDINFNTLYADNQRGKGRRKVEKLKCIMNYFRRVTDSMPTGTLTFRRQVLNQHPDWTKSNTEFKRIHVTSEGTIEDNGTGMLQVDFANKYLGGGALNTGLVQEEIRFMLCPEMIVSRLLTEALEKHEALIMTGCERFSDYVGYSDTFRWAGDHRDITPRDAWGRRHTEVVAIDALVFHSYGDQFRDDKLARELNKAWCGFYKNDSPRHLSAVATGNWGCGAFGGDVRLKSLLQLMAASEAGRDLCYFTFDDCDLRDDLHGMHTVLRERELTVGNVLQLVRLYYSYLRNRARSARGVMDVFEFIHNHFSTADARADSDDSDPESKKSPKQESGTSTDSGSKPRHTTSDGDTHMWDSPRGKKAKDGKTVAPGIDSQEMEYLMDLQGGGASPDYAADTP